MTHPTGDQFVLETSTSTGDVRATITAVAAGIRTLSINGIHLVPSYGEDETPPSGSGIVLVPWPNRIRDGKWSHDGTEAAVKALAEAEGLKLGKLAQPLRAALTGRTTSPGIFDVLVLLGQGESLARIQDQMTMERP